MLVSELRLSLLPRRVGEAWQAGGGSVRGGWGEEQGVVSGLCGDRQKEGQVREKQK